MKPVLEIALRVFAPSRELPPVRPVIVVCAWCPDKVQQEQAAQRHGAKVSHGICSRCQAREFGHLTPFPAAGSGFRAR